MANLQQFGRNLSRTTGQSSNQNPCKFVKLKQSSHTWGLGAPPPSLRLADRRETEKSAIEFVRGDRGWVLRTRSVLGLAPRLGGRPALELHVRPRRHLRVELARTGAGPVGSRRGTLLFGRRGPYSIAAPAWRQRDDEDYGAGVGFPGLVPAAAATEVAAAAGARRCRSRHAGRGAHAAPGAAGGRPPPEREAREEVRAGPGGGRGRGTGPAGSGGGAPRSSAAHLGSPAQAPPPHSPAIFSAQHGRLLQARLPRPPPLAQPRLRRAHPARPPPPPSAHDEARCRPLPRAWPPSPLFSRRSSSVGPGLLRPWWMVRRLRPGR